MRAAVAAAAAACIALAGCASLPPGGPDDVLSGKLSVQVEPHGNTAARNVSAAFDLRGGAERGELQLTSPLGTVMAQARWAPDDVRLTTADGERHFANLPALADEVLGEPLPLGALFDWLRGKPWSGAESRPLPTRGFEQLGWSISLDGFDNGLVVARRAAPPVVTVRAKLAR